MGVHRVKWQSICPARAIISGLKATRNEPLEREMRPDGSFVAKTHAHKKTPGSQPGVLLKTDCELLRRRGRRRRWRRHLGHRTIRGFARDHFDHALFLKFSVTAGDLGQFNLLR